MNALLLVGLLVGWFVLAASLVGVLRWRDPGEERPLAAAGLGAAAIALGAALIVVGPLLPDLRPQPAPRRR